MQRNVKLFWSYTKIKRQSNAYPSTMKLNNVTASTAEQGCQLFSDQFKSVYSSNPSDQPVDAPLNVSPQTANPIFITPWSVELTLARMDAKKNGGPDGIPNIFWINVSKKLLTR